MTKETGLPEAVVPLTERAIPAISWEQVALFTPDSLRAKADGEYRSELAENQPVIAIDIGGDSLSAVTFQLAGGRPEILAELSDLSGAKGGEGYLAALEQVADYAQNNGYPVGISFAGPFEGSRPLQGANVPVFMSELGARHSGDFAQLFPTLAAVENDAVAGLRAGALHAGKELGAKDVIYLINGSGMNTSVLKDSNLISMESGHVQVVPQLNPLGQDRPCGLFGAEYVCVESVAANKAGVEDLWQKQTAENLSGRQIESQYLAGNQLAGDLYDNSALVSAHVVLGVARALGIDLTASSSAVVGHGGTFKFPNYGDRVAQIASHALGGKANLLMTKDFSANACLEGAGLAALARLS